MSTKYTIFNMQKMAQAKNGKCLSTTYINTHTKLLWECNNGHTWYAAPSMVKNNYWCIECKKPPKLIDDTYHNKKQELDGYIISIGKKINLNLIGRIFNRLTVIDLKSIGINNEQHIWICLCKCGNIKEVNSRCLLYGKTQSCKCLQKERQIEGSKKHEGNSAMNNLICSYLNGARQRGFSCSITRKTFAHLFSLPCYYCGILPFSIHKSHSTTFIFNGIDRVDSTKGYEDGNVVTCCKTCNIAKANMSLKNFLAWIKRLHTNLIIKELI